MDIIQFLTTVLLLVSTVVVGALGYQLVKTLQQVRSTLERIDRIATGFERMGNGIQSGVAEMGGFLTSFSGIVKVIKYFNSRSKKSKSS